MKQNKAMSTRAKEREESCELLGHATHHLPLEDKLTASQSFLRMDISESRYPPSPEVIESVRSAAERVNEYPDFHSQKLRKALAEYNKVYPHSIVVGNGSDEIIDMISRAFLEKEDEILIFVPTYCRYEISAKIVGARVVKIPSFAGRSYVLNPEKALSRVSSKTRLIWVCNPNNPTGNLVPEEHILQLLDNSNAIVVVDECYFETSRQTSLSLLRKYRKLVIVRSLSKTFCLAGLRVGYAISNKRLIEKIQSVKQGFNVNLLAQVGAIAALKQLDYYNRMWMKLSTERERMARGLSRIGGVEILPSVTNFLFVNLSKSSKDPKKVYDELVRKRITVLPGWSREFSGRNKSYLRVLVSTREDNNTFMKEFANVLRRI